MSKFKYRKTSYADTKKQMAESDGNNRDSFLPPTIQMFKAAEGPNKIRILPPGWEDAEHYGYRVFVHFGIGPNKDSYLCPYHTVNPATGKSKQPCPLCEERNRVIESDPDYARTLKATPRVLIYLLDKQGKKGEAALKAWAMPATLDKAILQQAVDEDSQEVLPLDHPEEGYDITVYREGTAISTKYTCSVARRASEVDDFDELWDKISEENSLANQLIFFDYDYLDTVFKGGAVEADSKPTKKVKKKKSYSYEDLKDMDFDELANVVDEHELSIDVDSAESEEELFELICEELEVEKPKRRPAKKVEPEPEEDEEDEPEEDESDEPEPEPKSSSKRASLKRKAEPEDEEDEPEEDESDEPEPEPKKSSGRDRLAGLRLRRSK